MEQIDFFDLLPDLTLEDVFQAYYECRRKKRGTFSALRFEMNCEHNLYCLWQDILNHRYQIKSSAAFIVQKPVMREVFAASFRDRIVHHLVIGRLNNVFERLFNDYSFSCRAGKGTLYAVRTINQMLKECSSYYTQDCYVMRLDIQGYFFHINKDILWQQVQNIINTHYHNSNKEIILYLLSEILKNNPIHDCHLETPIESWEGLPKSKSLFYSAKNCGLPIGNLTSQVLANLYLTEFDHYVCSLDNNLFYGRYVDDMVLIHQDQMFLMQVKENIQRFLSEKLGLTLHPKKTTIRHYKQGFLFVGSYIQPGRIYPGKRLQKAFYKCIEELNKQWENIPEKEINIPLIQNTLSRINSYLGLLKYLNAWRIKLKGWNRLSQRIRNVYTINRTLTRIKIRPEIKQKIAAASRKELELFPLHNKKKHIKNKPRI